MQTCLNQALVREVRSKVTLWQQLGKYEWAGMKIMVAQKKESGDTRNHSSSHFWLHLDFMPVN